MKLGIVIQHYDARNDVRELVELLARDHDVVLFGAEEKLRDIKAPCETRAFQQRKRLSDRIWLQLFNLFGELPASRNNFLITELFKLAALPPFRRWIASTRLRLRMHLPSLMPFDFLLDRLAGSDFTPVDDIDRFLVITELSSPAFLARILQAGIPVDAYVYSWDHACKHVTFSKRVDRWLVWHEGIAEDLVTLQGIPRERIEVVGATQLAYIHEYLRRPELRVPKRHDRYVYYGCGVGFVDMARQEAKLIGFLADTLREVDPELVLLVRPYPMLANTDFFQALRQRPNVEFDEDYRAGRTDRSLTRDAIFGRLNLQEHAIAFVHCGTTMGLEGAYFDTPVLFLDLEDFDYDYPANGFMHLRSFIHQYHNERYMILQGYPNVISRSAGLRSRLEAVVEGSADHLEYNRLLSDALPLFDLATIAERLVAARGDERSTDGGGAITRWTGRADRVPSDSDGGMDLRRSSEVRGGSIK
jgi:hypothetical protein